MKKLFLSIFLSFAIILYSIPCAAYASMATTSNAQLNIDEEWIGDDGELVASSSDADSDADFVLDEQIEDLMSFSGVPMLMSSGDVPIVYPYADVYKDGKWVTSIRGTFVKCTGLNNYFTFPDRTDGSKYTNIYFYVAKKDFPSPGSYGVEWRHKQAHIGYSYSSSAVRVEARKNGVKTASSSASGNLTVGEYAVSKANVTIGYDTSAIVLITQITNVGQLDVSVPVSDPYAFTFQKNAGSSTIVSPDITAGNTTSASDVIAQNTASMSDTLKEIVGTISNQLAALWDQMYNLMHVPQLANDDKNTDRLINSGQENTEQVTGAIEEHGNFIIEGLKSLFIPSDEFFKSYFDDLYAWFSDRFGFLSFPIDLLVMFSDLILSSDEADCILTLPSFEIMGEQLLQEQSFNLTDFLEENFMVVLTALRMGTSIMLIMAFVNLCGDKWDEVMRN